MGDENTDKIVDYIRYLVTLRRLHDGVIAGGGKPKKGVTWTKVPITEKQALGVAITGDPSSLFTKEEDDERAEG